MSTTSTTMFSILAKKKEDGNNSNQSKSSTSDLKLPSINGKDVAVDEGKANKKVKKKKEKKKEAEAYDIPEEFHYWIRDKDKNGMIFYVNSQTRESSMLGPCSVCYKISDKWCLQCESSYCDKHFAKKHRCDEDLDEDEIDDALRWQY